MPTYHLIVSSAEAHRLATWLSKEVAQLDEGDMPWSTTLVVDASGCVEAAALTEGDE